MLLQRCPHVERLCVQNCRKLTDASLRYMVRDGKKLSAVDIGGCFNLTAPGVDALCSIHPNVSRSDWSLCAWTICYKIFCVLKLAKPSGLNVRSSSAYVGKVLFFDLLFTVFGSDSTGPILFLTHAHILCVCLMYTTSFLNILRASRTPKGSRS